MNEPSAAAIWRKLNEITDKLHQLSEHVARANAINESYHRELDQQRAKVEILEQDNHKAQGAISMLRFGMGFVLSVALTGGAWAVNSINQLKQDMAIIQSHREDNK